MYNDTQAKREGWALFECDDGKTRIQRLDDPQSVDESYPAEPVFDSDEAAIAFVQAKAAEDSPMHSAALAQHSPEKTDA